MRTKTKLKARILSLVLTAGVVVTMLPGTVLAAEEAPLISGTVCHPLHDENCGYSSEEEGTSCTHSCEICQPEVAEIPECICTVKCVQDDPEQELEALVNSECLVCGANDSDLSGCVGEAPAPFATSNFAAKGMKSLDLCSNVILDKDGQTLSPAGDEYDMLASEGWKWNKATKALTLNGFQVEATDRCGILFPKGTTIELIGDNSVTSNGSIGLQMD